MDDLLVKAAELGRALRDAEAFRALREAEAAVMRVPDSVKLAEALGTLQQERMDAERAGKALAPGFEERLATIVAAAGLDPRIQALSLAQSAFQAVVERVNRTMLGELK